MPIWLCNSGVADSLADTVMRVVTSNKRYAQSILQKSFDFSLDLSIEVSRLEIATTDISDIGSAVTSRNSAFNEEL